MNGTRIFLVVLLAVSFVGIASAEMVTVQGYGQMSRETYEVMMRTAKALNKSYGVCLDCDQKSRVATNNQTQKQNAGSTSVATTASGQVASASPATIGSSPLGVVSKSEKTKKSAVREPGLALGLADHEVFAYAGYHYAFRTHTKGGWLSAKNTQWWGSRNYPWNLGVGLSFDASIGKTGQGYRWGYVEPGINFGSYVFGDQDDFLTRLNLAYRVPLHKNNTSGFVPGAELQYTHAYSNRFALIAQVQGKYFRHDSHGGASLLGEYLVNPDWRIKAGLVADVGIGGENTLVGVGPHFSAEYDSRWVAGVNLLLLGPGGPTIGPFVGFKYSSYLAAADKARRGASVEKTSGNIDKPLPEASEIKMEDDGSGFATWGPLEPENNESEITLGEKIKQARGQ